MQVLRNITFISLAAGLAMTSCHTAETSDEWSTDTPVDESRKLDAEPYSDLKMFELRGPVKDCAKATYYKVSYAGNKVSFDTMPETVHKTDLYFDKLGNYVPSSSEKIERDTEGRITYWRDRRPNVKGVDPGLLRDTLRYTHVNDNVLQSKGMGEFAITVYDNDGRIVGQYTDPDIAGTQMSAFNVYREFDSYGNWTERLTVWTTQSAGGRPHVNYTLDRREITYY